MRGDVRQRRLTRHQQQMGRGGDGQGDLGGGDRPAGRQPDHERKHRRRAGQRRLHRQVGGQQRALPQVTGLRLGEQVRGVARGSQRQRHADPGQHLPGPGLATDGGQDIQREHAAVPAEDEGAADQPAAPVMPGEDQVEAQRVLEVPDQQHAGDGEEGQRHRRRGPPDRRVAPAQVTGQGEQHRDGERARGDALRPGVEAHPPAPRRVMRDVVGQQRGGRGPRPAGVAGHDELRVRCALGRPGEQASVRAAGRQRVQRGLVRALVVHAGPGLLLRAAHLHRLTRHDARDRRGRVVAVPDQDRPGGAHRDAGRLQARRRGGARTCCTSRPSGPRG